MFYNNGQKFVSLIAFVVILTCLSLVGFAAEGDITVTASFQHLNTIQNQFPPEGNEQINVAKEQIACPGSMVYFYLHNQGKEPVTLQNIVWGDGDISSHTGSYQLIWYRAMPDTIEPSSEGEIALCLRAALTESTPFTIVLQNGQKVNATVDAKTNSFRIQTLRFNSELNTAYIYVQRRQSDIATLPEKIYINGVNFSDKLKWLSEKYCNEVRIGIVHFAKPLVRGSIQTFRVTSKDGQIVDATSIRAFGERSIFGTYGTGNLKRYADNGVLGYNSFRQTFAAQLEQADKLGVRVVAITHGQPNADTVGHKATYAFGLVDEPDVSDYGVDDRPMQARIGAHAPEMVQMEAGCRSDDPLTATTLTIDLTFNPYNYFVYAPIVDIANPDCYPVSHGWSIRETIKYAETMRQAATPNPFTFTYQGCWEEYAIPQGRWISGGELLEKGFDQYRDTSRVRGFGRKPVPSEVRIPMLYAVGCGATGLWSYTDASEGGGGMMFHGSDSLPELWSEIGRTSRALKCIGSLIDISHATVWAKSDTNTIWLRTLWAGEKGAIVIAVNENYRCRAEGFEQRPAENVIFRFDDLPWLQAGQISRVTDDRLVRVSSQRKDDHIQWTDSISDAEVYLLVRDVDALNFLKGMTL